MRYVLVQVPAAVSGFDECHLLVDTSPSPNGSVAATELSAIRDALKADEP